MVDERDMMYSGFCQNNPGGMIYGNYGYQGMPGSLMMPGMQAMPMQSYQNMHGTPMQQTMPNISENNLYDLNSRISSLESRVKSLEQKISGYSYGDDNSVYML